MQIAGPKFIALGVPLQSHLSINLKFGEFDELKPILTIERKVLKKYSQKLGIAI